MKKVIIYFALIAICLPASSQENKPVTGTIEFISPKLSKLISKNASVEILAEGFQFTEGPLWLEKEKMLLFSDVPANAIYKWTETKGKELYVQHAGYTDTAKRGGFMGPNGLILSNDGKLMICQHGDRRVAIMDAPIHAPATNFITSAGAYNGKKLNSPNDLILTAKGDLYFTDPSYGFERGPKDPKKELPFEGVYRMDKAGNLTLLVDSLEAPNGIAMFPDNKTLLVSNSDGRKKRWYAYNIAPDGSLTNARMFYDASNETAAGGCDGLKIDSNGNVFATGPGGVWIFSKTGELLGKIRVAGSIVANCALSPDGRTIYLTATKYLLRVKMR